MLRESLAVSGPIDGAAQAERTVEIKATPVKNAKVDTGRVALGLVGNEARPFCVGVRHHIRDDKFVVAGWI